MSFSSISIAFAILFGFLTTVFIYRYSKKGLNSSLMSLGASVFGMILSLILSPLVSGAIAEVLFKLAFKTLSKSFKLINDMPATQEMLSALIAALLNSFIFLIMFFVVRKLLKVLLAIICKVSLKKSADDVAFAKDKERLYKRYGKLFSGIIGGVTAFMVCTVISAPLLGSLNVVLKLVDVVEAYDSRYINKYSINGVNVSEIVHELEDISNDAVIGTFYVCGGEQLYSIIFSASTNDGNADIMNELDALENAAGDLSAIVSSMNKNGKLTRQDAETLRSLANDVQELELTHYVVADMFSLCTDTWLKGGKFFGAPKPKLHSSVEQSFDSILRVCSETNKDSVKANVNTVMNVYAMVLESGFMESASMSYEEMIEFVDESGIIDDFNAELAANPNMSDIRVSSIAMSVIADTISIEQIGADKYNAIMSNISYAISNIKDRDYGSEEERVEVLSNAAKDYIKEHDIDVPDSMVRLLAQELIVKVDEKDLDNITPQDVSELFAEYLSSN